MGPSGSGKSTLARALAGLVPHEVPGTWSGSLQVGDLDIGAASARIVSGSAGIVFQEPESQLVMLRVEDEVAFGLENRGWERDAMAVRVAEVLETVGLPGFEARATAALSGGEQQRLAIADVLAPMPGLLVFDEPTANLDPPGMESVFERLAALASTRERTLVIVEHRLDAALPLADQVLLLDGDGRQLAFGAPKDVGRAHAADVAALGSWVPRAWQGWAEGAAGAARDVGVGHGEAAAASRERSAATSDARPHPVLAAVSVTVRYPRGADGTERVAIADASLTLRAGERVALVGPNGSGKSTLLFALGGLRRPSSGTIRVGQGSAPPDSDPARLPGRLLARLLGLVFQNPELGFVAPTCSAEIAAGLPAGDRPADPADPAVVGALREFGLEPLAGEDPFRLSEGEQRRLGIAAATVAGPAILMLDEPTFALDRRGAVAVVDLLDRLRAAGQAQLMATHDPRLIPACDRVVGLDAGRVVFDGPSAAFLADPPYRPAGPWRA
jgi:energy-coupling factor transporter ATP-binding protein EcfA2